MDHLDDFLAQYEVVTQAAQAASGGTTHCRHCGANSADPYICEYCGSQLAEKPASSGKIQVSAASEIPNPIMQAQDVIYDRYSAVIKKSSTEKTDSGSLLSVLFADLLGTQDKDEDGTSALGAKMSEAEIREAASLYGITVGTYLTGLDNGKYLTLSAKKEADAAGKSASSYTPASAGLAGMAGIGMLASGLMSANRRRPGGYGTPQRQPQQPSSPAPSSYPQQNRWDDRPQHKPSQPSSKQEDTIRRPQQQQTNKRDDILQRPSVSKRDEIPSRPASSRRDESTRRPSESSRQPSSSQWKERDPGKRRRG